MKEQSSFSWQIEPPSKKASLGSARPKGTLHIESEAGGSESIMLPASLARRLASQKKSGKLKPSSRAELLYEVGEQARVVAWERLTGLLNRRDYSSKEASEKLRRDGFSARVTDESIQRAVSAGLINDTRFADAFIRTKIAAGWGARRIEMELKRRGIEVSSLVGWPYEYFDPDDERSRALEIARRKVVHGANPTQKLARFLVSRGYRTSMAIDVAREVMDERAEGEQ